MKVPDIDGSQRVGPQPGINKSTRRRPSILRPAARAVLLAEERTTQRPSPRLIDRVTPIQDPHLSDSGDSISPSSSDGPSPPPNTEAESSSDGLQAIDEALEVLERTPRQNEETRRELGRRDNRNPVKPHNRCFRGLR